MRAQQLLVVEAVCHDDEAARGVILRRYCIAQQFLFTHSLVGVTAHKPGRGRCRTDTRRRQPHRCFKGKV